MPIFSHSLFNFLMDTRARIPLLLNLLIEPIP